MSSEGMIWSSVSQWGKETTAGSAVAATRKMYFVDPNLTRVRDPRVHRFAVGRRDNVLAVTGGPIQAGGAVAMPMSADEIIELALITLQGGVTPSTPSGATNARLWSFKPQTTVDTATVEWDDGARVWQGVGVKGDTFQIQGSVDDTNMVSSNLFGNDVVAGSLTGALSERVPTFMEGWQTRLYFDTFGSAPFQTPIPGLLINWNVQLGNQLGRIYTADNTLATRRLSSGELNLTSTLTFDAYSAQALTQFNAWDAGTKLVCGLEFLGPADEIEAGANEVQTITVSGTPTGGTFVINVLGVNVTLNFDDTAAEVQTAINAALAVFGTGHTVGVAGAGFPGAAATVTFSGSQVAGRDIAQMTLVTNGLTGGTAPDVAFGTTTPGRSGRRYVRVAIPGAWTAVDLSGDTNGIRTYQFDMQAVYDPTSLSAMFQLQAQNARTTAF